MTIAHERALRRLSGKFQPEHRYENFGHFLERISIDGLRGVSNLQINFRYPVSVISGPNGSGKSTIAHAALCVQRQSMPGRKSFNVSQFFFQSDIDSDLIASNAQIFSYYTWSSDPSPRYSRIYRQVNRWRGYDRRLSKGIIYIGLLVYLPKVERRDLSVYARTRLRPGPRTPIDAASRAHINRILGTNSSSIDIQNLRDRYRQIDVFCVSRGAHTAYSESNMGLGEGRVIKMITEIEAAPPKSMIVIDEPEIALHEAAQAKFAHYLIDAADRLGHQFIITSHSPAIIGELPSEALVYVERRAGRVVSVEGATFKEAKALLTANSAENTVWVEDELAKTVLSNMLRRIDASMIRSVDVCVLTGGATAIRAALRSLKNIGVTRTAVLDADQGEDRALGILALPGSDCPEVEIFGIADVVSMLEAEYGLDVNELDHIKATRNPHSWFYDVADACGELEDNLRLKCVGKYVAALDENFLTDFGQKLRSHMNAIAG
jgi:predicted ATPase